MNQEKIANALKSVLADSYSLYFKTQNFHWNVTGPHFKSLHSLFEEQYTDLADAIDEIAERIRWLGQKVPGSLKFYSDLTSISSSDEHADSTTMIKELLQGQDLVIKTLKAALTVAKTFDDEGTCDLLIARIKTHEKNSWILKSSI
ncbi:MAG: DNA starvation/stationary phase protection protein [Rickettsiaceae bacterium]|jgi:starvation-inducible DNA-binding protein|nr:DNA starvation/stationary phase protection protein [Rickettsiales bacterium]MCP5362480.1 DNA starvation/stationary phase protection protein [Rickettsiaceae bacterium]MCP5374487.1 DNA starvation/stationary phase protection protein [Rickettsiaceae bacterium]MCP5378094.1 DNA starvation/stationary phase protection protein [Rickettsiaceae bacterium]